MLMTLLDKAAQWLLRLLLTKRSRIKLIEGISSVSKITYQPQELVNASLSEWQIFVKSPIWRVLSGELAERDRYITQLLKSGDTKWSDNEMRARLSEIEFVLQTPSAIILELELLKTNKDKKE